VELTYPAVAGLGRVLFRALDLRISVEGDAQVPTRGPVVLAGNHVSFLDPLLLGLAARRSARRPRFLARHDLWRPPVAGALLRRMQHVPVDRAAPAAAYLGARSLLRAGEAVALFPEAGISTSFTVRSLMPGAVALARETGAPLLPVALWGCQRVLGPGRPPDLTRGRPVSVVVGPPLVVEPAEDLRSATGRLGAVLQSMLDELQVRPEHRPAPGEPAPWHPAHLGGGAPTPADARLVESVPAGALAPAWAERLSRAG
jgi:1-acyl-sn-glycerol-3-phosphate acyltransferase